MSTLYAPGPIRAEFSYRVDGESKPRSEVRFAKFDVLVFVILMAFSVSSWLRPI